MSSTTSSFRSDTSPDWPSNVYLARYIGFVGAGGGGGALCNADGGVIELVFTAGGVTATVNDFPGNGRAAGVGRDAEDFEGPPARNNLPSLIGLAVRVFRFAGGRDKLPAGSPEGTCTTWLL